MRAGGVVAGSACAASAEPRITAAARNILAVIAVTATHGGAEMSLHATAPAMAIPYGYWFCQGTSTVLQSKAPGNQHTRCSRGGELGRDPECDSGE
jgi:hypothetical protein